MNDSMWGTVRDGVNNTADKMIDQGVSTDFKPAARQTVETLNNLGKLRDDYRTLNDQMVALPEKNLNGATKRLTGWQKFKNVFKNIWTVAKKPMQGIIGALPGGKMINDGAGALSGLFNRFKSKKQ
ncbi:Hypothetical_protein [Hexamita inflata]|uniref:Hypothetical_protein n=1 Tax=Hexamita inflata TaxID=28002 RepID=A0AA86Q6Z8_9EUKA|nr:Hypothetical protein HINF_LOCUS41224 [Hexamita inflata]